MKTGMSFFQALDLLFSGNGSSIRRASWSKDEEICLHKDYDVRVLRYNKITNSITFIQNDDIFANDWESLIVSSAM